MWESPSAEIQALRDDTEVVLIDLPGFGESDVVESWTMEGVSRALCQLLTKTGKSSVLLGGLSMGGYAALEFYREYGSMLRGLILCDTKAEADSDAQKRLRSQFAADALKRGPEAAIERLYSSFVTEKTDPETAVQIQQWMLATAPQAIASALIAMRDRHDSLDLLPIISLPTLVIVGEMDTTCSPASMRQMAQNIANSSFEMIPDAAHLSAVEQPERWAEAVSSFIDRLVS